MFRLPEVLFFHLGQPTSRCLYLLGLGPVTTSSSSPLHPALHPRAGTSFLLSAAAGPPADVQGSTPNSSVSLFRNLSVSSYSYQRSQEGRNLAQLAFFLLELAYFWHRENRYITTMYLCNQNSLLFPQTTSDPSEPV